MAIKFKDVLLGLGQEILEDTEQREESVRETFRLSYADSLEQARAERQKRRQKEEQLTTIGNALIGLGMNDSQALTLLNSGPEVASKYLEDLMTAKKADENFDVNNFVTAVEDSGLTLDEGIQRMMGTLDVQTGEAFRSPVEGNIFISPEKIIEREQQQLESAFGEDFATISAEARGQYTRGEIPVGEINLSALYTQEEQDQARLNELRLLAEQKRLDALDDPKEMSDSDQRSNFRILRNEYLQALELRSGIKLPRDANNQYITPSVENEIATQIFNQATDLAIVDVRKIMSGDISGPMEALDITRKELGLRPKVITEESGSGTDDTDTFTYETGDATDGVEIEQFEGVTDSEFSIIKNVFASQTPGLSGKPGENIIYQALLERLQSEYGGGTGQSGQSARNQPRVKGLSRARDLADMYSKLIN